MAEVRSADEETRADVDLMIMDYLLYMATKALLGERVAEKMGESVPAGSGSDLPLRMIDTFLPLFKRSHPDQVDDASVQFRLKHLKFVTLLIKRFYASATTPTLSSLGQLRQSNSMRAQVWWKHSHSILPEQPSLDSVYAQLSIPADILERNRAHVRTQLCITDFPTPVSQTFYGTAACLSLLDLLPAFLSLSAARTQLQLGKFRINTLWMRLAAEFMLQAALEQYLVYGSVGWKSGKEAFAWGRTTLHDTWDEEEEVNEMFTEEDEDYEIEGWEDVWREFMEKMHPPPNTSTVEHLENLATEYPVADFETRLLGFLDALQQSQPQPALAQLEDGKVEGLNDTETEALKNRVRFQLR